MILMLPMPPSVNNLYRNIRGGGRVSTRAYREWRAEAYHAIKFAKPPYYSGRVRLTMAFGRPDERRRDVSNFVKAIEDALVHMMVIEDDSLVQSISAEWTTEHPGQVAVTVEQIQSSDN